MEIEELNCVGGSSLQTAKHRCAIEMGIEFEQICYIPSWVANLDIFTEFQRCWPKIITDG